MVGRCGGGERVRLYYLSLHCHHQHDCCIKTGQRREPFYVSLIVRDKVTRQCPQTIRRVEAESNRGPSAYQPNASPQGQSGSQICKIPLSAFCRPRQPKQHGNNGQLTIKTQTRLVLFKLLPRYLGCRRDT